MRYCVSGRQPYSILKKADEVKVQYRDRDRIMDFVERIPNKTIILEVPGNEYDWATWQMYDEKFYEFYIALQDLTYAEEYNNHNIKWYWPYPITSFYELGMILALRPSYLMIGAPLSFDLDKVAALAYADGSANPVPLRMICNNARPAYIPETDKIKDLGICGQWIRPEDAATYASRVQCFEFDAIDLSEEEVLLRIYQENKEWPGNLNIIIKNLNYNVDNRAIPDEFAEARMSCGQKCWSTSHCHLCPSALKFATALRKAHYERGKKIEIDNN